MRRRLLLAGGGGGKAPRDGLIAEWLFDNNLLDTSGNGNHLGGPTNISYAASGLASIENAAVYGGPNAGVKASTNILPKSGPLTISFWANTLTTSGWGAILSQNRSGTSYNGLEVYRYNSAVHFVGYKSDSECFHLQSTLTKNVWGHFVMTWDGTVGGKVTLYKDGAQAATATANRAITSQNYADHVGGKPASSGYDTTQGWQGTLAAVRYYNRVLTYAEIAQLYNGGKGC